MLSHTDLLLSLSVVKGPCSSEQARAPESSREEEERTSYQGPKGGAGGSQEEKRPGNRAHEKTTETRAGKSSNI